MSSTCSGGFLRAVLLLASWLATGGVWRRVERTDDGVRCGQRGKSEPASERKNIGEGSREASEHGRPTRLEKMHASLAQRAATHAAVGPNRSIPSPGPGPGAVSSSLLSSSSLQARAPHQANAFSLVLAGAARTHEIPDRRYPTVAGMSWQAMLEMRMQKSARCMDFRLGCGGLKERCYFCRVATSTGFRESGGL
ncbi:hypothetical protein BC567DRAFT_207145 [Phyllosticta citribraziliensis]